VSEHTKADITHFLGRPPEDITVVYSGVDGAFRPLEASQVTTFRRREFGDRPYILHVGTLEPRKNIDLLIGAFAECRRRLALPHVLALVGARGWQYETLFSLVRRLQVEDHVRFAEFVPEEQLPLWYNGADLFAYPSAYEGFGLPVLEAMACGVPTITSASSALLELAGGACLTVEPGSQEALQLALIRMLTEPDTRERLRRSGLARAASFTWDQCARATAAEYHRAMEHRDA
jgi:glycosyltransferase involved in cell wall biosynthesis